MRAISAPLFLRGSLSNPARPKTAPVDRPDDPRRDGARTVQPPSFAEPCLKPPLAESGARPTPRTGPKPVLGVVGEKQRDDARGDATDAGSIMVSRPCPLFSETIRWIARRTRVPVATGATSKPERAVLMPLGRFDAHPASSGSSGEGRSWLAWWCVVSPGDGRRRPVIGPVSGLYLRR